VLLVAQPRIARNWRTGRRHRRDPPRHRTAAQEDPARADAIEQWLRGSSGVLLLNPFEPPTGA